MNRKEEIRKELEGISPFMASLDLQPAFKVPKGYFTELPDTILESVSPLAEIKAQPFTVPKNYFQSLPDLVLDQIKAEAEAEVETVISEPEVSSAPQVSWLDELINSVAVLFQPRYALRLASVAVLIIAGYFFLNSPNNDETLAQAEVNPLEMYGLSLDDLNDDDLAMLLSDEPLSDTEQQRFDEIEPLLDELLNDLDDLDDEDLEEFM